MTVPFSRKKKNSYHLEKKSSKKLTLYHAIPTLNISGKEAFENIMGKGKNAGNHRALVYNYLCSYDTFTVLSQPSNCFHCAFTAFTLHLEDTVTSQREPNNLHVNAPDDHHICITNFSFSHSVFYLFR